MKTIIESTLKNLTDNGNLRRIPEDKTASSSIDLSSNDYLGLASHPEIQTKFLEISEMGSMCMTSSASRLLARSQNPYNSLEQTLEEAYGEGRKAILFNSGYHANTGIVSAFAGTPAYVLADKLVHASIIDGIKLSGLPFARFRHNDMTHLDTLARKATSEGKKLIIIAESVYSMDGDCADIDSLAEIKTRYPGSLLYIDEAHGVGVEGPAGLGLCKASNHFDSIDILVGTFGKALASSGAFAIVSEEIRQFLLNRARSFIFSTAIPPICAMWSRFTFDKALGMDTERKHLKDLSAALATELSHVGGTGIVGHIQPLIVGDPHKAVALSGLLKIKGFDVLPIRTPTVPPGTDRLRFSLSASLDINSIKQLGKALRDISKS